MENRTILALILIGIVFFLALLLFYLASAYQKSLHQCSTEESGFCYTFACEAGATTNTCGQYAYRCIDNKTVRCSSAPLINVAIADGDNICQT